jgi:hypothetical protein
MTAKDRYGNEYNVGDIVQMIDFPVLYKTMLGAELLIVDIKEFEACESGFNVLLKCTETGKTFSKYLDTNWIQKFKTT